MWLPVSIKSQLSHVLCDVISSIIDLPFRLFESSVRIVFYLIYQPFSIYKFKILISSNNVKATTKILIWD